jgi:hypothetical protein
VTNEEIKARFLGAFDLSAPTQARTSHELLLDVNLGEAIVPIRELCAVPVQDAREAIDVFVDARARPLRNVHRWLSLSSLGAVSCA